MYAAAACADRDAAATAAQLRDLAEAHLVETRAGDRFELHDLVRVFAQARARDEVPARERRQAIDRMLLYYRFATARAMAEFAPQDRVRRPDIADPGMATPELADRAAARAWLDAERGNLLATTVFADEHNRPMHTALMSWLLFRYLDVAGYYHDAERLHTRASSSPDPVSRGHALTSRGIVRAIRGNHEAALGDCERALSEFQQVGDLLGQARARTTLGGLHWRLAPLRRGERAPERGRRDLRGGRRVRGRRGYLAAPGHRPVPARGRRRGAGGLRTGPAGGSQQR